ncbi:hypothetical protein C805_00770 [Eubacterium sp. 14-2]|nr:hypothetical protein C805_00770 [Eubacterium sp. 14-2]
MEHGNAGKVTGPAEGKKTAEENLKEEKKWHWRKSL